MVVAMDDSPAAGPEPEKPQKKYTYYCIVCKTKPLGEDIKFHRIPKDPAVASKWMLALNLEPPLKPSYRVCSLHFNWPSDYRPSGKGLKDSVVPSINVPGHVNLVIIAEDVLDQTMESEEGGGGEVPGGEGDMSVVTSADGGDVDGGLEEDHDVVSAATDVVQLEAELAQHVKDSACKDEKMEKLLRKINVLRVRSKFRTLASGFPLPQVARFP